MSAIISAEENEQRMQLYKMGLSDAEIGELLYVEFHAIFHWRKKIRLPCNGHRSKVPLKAYLAVKKLAEEDDVYKEVLQAIKPKVEDIKDALNKGDIIDAFQVDSPQRED